MLVPTPRQLEVLRFIADSAAGNRLPPTLDEIRLHFGWHSHNAASDHINALIRKGLVRRGRLLQGRAMRITAEGYIALDHQRGRIVAPIQLQACSRCSAQHFNVDGTCPICDVDALGVKRLPVWYEPPNDGGRELAEQRRAGVG